ncbi:hypothetical protein GGU11DRAFT_748681 [Lentinula aff. detonsa]|nr:hypothetical protein GGU11DRAFT_748681 [Lentinula aff. detonsa]
MDAQSQHLFSLPIPPSTLAALTKAGYETLDDLPRSDSANQLIDVLNIPFGASQTLYSSSQRPNGGGPGILPSTQTAASLIGSISKQKSRRFTTHCPPLDALLDGGLPEGGILELSGPPGSSKERILLNMVRSFVEAGRSILLVDCQNMCDPCILDELMTDNSSARRLVSYLKIGSLTELMMFVNNLSLCNDSFDLLAISCISYPFQNARLTKSARNYILEKIKQALTKVNISQNVTIVVTSQLVTKLVNIDGTTGNFDSVGAKGVMVPALGHVYLPSAKAFRVLVALNGPTLDTGEISTTSSFRLLAPLKPGL